jgi:hypothetical protein
VGGAPEGVVVTFAIALWLARSLALGLWVVEHVSQVARARRRGAEGAAAWGLPVMTNWHHGDRVGPSLWVLAVLGYIVATVASEAAR